MIPRQTVLALLALLITAGAATAQNMMLGELDVLHDSITGNFLCSVDTTAFGSDLTTTVFYGETGWEILTIDGDTIDDGMDYTFTNIAGDHDYHIVALLGDSIVDGYLQFTYLPIVWLKGEFGNDYTPGTVSLYMPGQSGKYDMLAKIKWRGWYTNYYFKHKRNYHIRFLDEAGEKKDRRLFDDMRKDDSWLLDAGQIDLARVRNRVGTELWMDFKAEPYYFDQEPKMLTGVRGREIEVFLNGEYRGLFGISEALDRKQMKLKKYEELDNGKKVIHGIFWITDRYNDITYMSGINEDWNNKLAKWTGYEVKYPDIDEVKPTDWSTLYNAVKFVATSSDAEFCAHVGEYFDLPMVRDYMVLIQALMGYDNNGKNMYWACYDQTVDRKLMLLPWDLDATLGQTPFNITLHHGVAGATVEVQMVHNLLARLKALNPDHFYDGVIKRYHDLRQTILNTDSLTARYVNRINDVIACGAAAREKARWSGDYDVNYLEIDLPSERNFLIWYIKKRLNFLDENVFVYNPVYGDVNEDFEVDVFDLNVIINSILGRPEQGQETLDTDVNGDGVTDTVDLDILIRLIMQTD